MSTAIPTGPARGTRSSARGPRRRGGGPGRVDRDGDLSMGGGPSMSNGIAKRSSTNTRSSTSTRSTTNTRAPTRGRGASAVRGLDSGRMSAIVANQERILRHLDAGGSGSAARVSSGPSKRLSRHDKTLKVEGVGSSKAASNPDGGLQKALEFLERKAENMCHRRVLIKKSQMTSDSTLYIVLSKDDAEDMIKLNGWVFASSTLQITESPDGIPPSGATSAHTEDIKQKLQGFLSQRYDPNLKLLNLSSLGTDPLLVEMKLFIDKERAEKAFKVMMTICESIFVDRKARREAVVSVSLANNAIEDVSLVFELAATFPELKNLDLSGNQLSNIKGLGRWRDRFPQLETLLLGGNPIEATDPSFKDELLRWYPKLQNLSNVVVRTPEQLAAAEAAKAAARPIPIPHHGPDFRDTMKIGENFLMQFLPAYDNDRANLAATFYDDNSRFSLCVVNWSQQKDDERLHNMPWAPYLKFSRNLNKITTTSARIQRLIKGRQTIADVWRTLPATKHPDLAAEFSKYIVDCHPIHALPDPSGQSPLGVDGLAINIHGEFDESDSATGKVGKRSFSRAFVLGPSPTSSSGVRVVSDMLVLRAWTAMPVAQPATAPPAAPAPAQVSPQQQQEQLVAELSRRTNMTAQYSEMCLSQANWDLNAAMVKFAQTKPHLGPEAFLPPTAIFG